MKRKLYVTRTVKLACLFLALMVTTAFLQHYVLRRLDHNSMRLDGFYLEDSDSVDVVLLGASDIYTSFIPGVAYDKFGFTSYAVATESITSEGVITALKEVVRTQHPKLILIEANAFLYGKSDNESKEAHIRKFIDNIPISYNKIDYITRNASPDEWPEYYMPIIKYHSIWQDYPKPGRRAVSELKQDLRGYSILKGFRTTTSIYDGKLECLNDKVADENKTIKMNPVLEDQLNALIDYIDENDLNVVFVRAPHYVNKQTYNRVKRSNMMAEVVNSRGYDYLNLEREVRKIGIDDKTDFYNVDHVNIYGATKFTDYLGSIIRDRYGITASDQTRVEQARWERSAEAANKLCRYCDDLITKGEEIKLEEDINTLSAINNY